MKTITAAAGVESGKYCVFGPGKSFSMLLSRPQPGGALLFGLSTWTPAGSDFSVAGTARPSGSGWIYRDKMNALNPEDRCGINILRSSDGAYRITTADGARCEGLAGQGAVLTDEDVFPPSSRVGEAPTSFDLAYVGCDKPRGR